MTEMVHQPPLRLSISITLSYITPINCAKNNFNLLILAPVLFYPHLSKRIGGCGGGQTGCNQINRFLASQMSRLCFDIEWSSLISAWLTVAQQSPWVRIVTDGSLTLRQLLEITSNQRVYKS